MHSHGPSVALPENGWCKAAGAGIAVVKHLAPDARSTFSGNHRGDRHGRGQDHHDHDRIRPEDHDANRRVADDGDSIRRGPNSGDRRSTYPRASR